MTPEQFEAIQNVIGFAAEDQEDYAAYGNPGTDYGAKWPEVAAARAADFRKTAEWLSEQGGPGGVVDQLNSIADGLEKSGKEAQCSQ
jgi:hypothetical protein